MRWFEGTIPEAIQETKTSRKLLVVYVFDATEDSTAMTAVLEDEAVTEALPPEKAVALKLESGTDSFHQFSVFYPVLILPSVYFIGDNGTPLEVVGGHQDAVAFLERTRNAYKFHEEGVPVADPPAPAASNTSVAAAPTESSSPSSAPDEAAGATASTSAKPLEERVLTAQEKIQEQNKERIRKEQEEHKNRELVRRKVGQV